MPVGTVRGWTPQTSAFREGPLFSDDRPKQPSPPHVPCAPWHSAHEDVVFRSRLQYFGQFFWTDCSDLSAAGARSAEHCNGQHQLDNMLTATMAAFGWLNIIICINFAGCGRADTVWVAHIERGSTLTEVRQLEAERSPSVLICVDLRRSSSKAKLGPLELSYTLSGTRVSACEKATWPLRGGRTDQCSHSKGSNPVYSRNIISFRKVRSTNRTEPTSP